MLGTFGGALEARQVDASNGKLTAEVTGEVETEDNVLVIRRIHVAMHLVAATDLKDKIERVHGMYAMNCPLYRTFSWPARRARLPLPAKKHRLGPTGSRSCTVRRHYGNYKSRNSTNEGGAGS